MFARLYLIAKPAVEAAVVAFSGAFPSAAIITDLKAAKLAVVAGIAAGIAAGVGAVYGALAPLWGKLGNLLRRWKPSQ
jgi:hypothetical protein